MVVVVENEYMETSLLHINFLKLRARYTIYSQVLKLSYMQYSQLLRYCTDKLGRTDIEVIKLKGRGHLRKKFCGQDEELGSIMRVKLVTGSCPEQSPVIAYIKTRSKVLITSGNGASMRSGLIYCGTMAYMYTNGESTNCRTGGSQWVPVKGDYMLHNRAVVQTPIWLPLILRSIPRYSCQVRWTTLPQD